MMAIEKRCERTRDHHPHDWIQSRTDADVTRCPGVFTPRQQREVDALRGAILTARWPDGDAEGFPTKQVADMVAEHLVAKGWALAQAPGQQLEERAS